MLKEEGLKDLKGLECDIGYLSSGTGMSCFYHPYTCVLLGDSSWNSSHSKSELKPAVFK